MTHDAELEKTRFHWSHYGLMYASGFCYNDSKERFRSGEYITTSIITNYDVQDKLIHTKNTVYQID